MRRGQVHKKLPYQQDHLLKKNNQKTTTYSDEVVEDEDT